MRNKKLISMLMLSAGFAACTQDELVDTPNVNNVDQKDLIEDVVLNVSFGDDAITRAGYAGEWDAEEGAVYPYKNFYLEPDVTSDGTLDLSDNVTLKGDMIGYCLTNGANAITNYPFYIAGYGSTDLVEGEGEDATTTKNVYVFANQEDGKHPLYVLNVAEDQTVNVVEEASEITSSVDRLASENGVAAGDLDATKGILRTNTGIMKGDYVAYFPYQEDFLEPGGIKVKGETPIKALFEAGDISENTTQQKSLKVVDIQTENNETVTKSFYDYMFAVTSGTTSVEGGKNGGEVKLAPRTNAWTFAIKNVLAADANAEAMDNAVQTIKRVTVRPADSTAAPFLMDGYVPLTGLSTIVGDAKTAESLIGVSFEDLKVSGEAEAVAAEEGDEITPNTVYYVTIPFYTDVNYTGKYIVEVYNTSGQVLALETRNEGALALGMAYRTTLNLADGKFEDAVRKIFDAEDFTEEVMAGGTLELMADVTVPASFTETVEADLDIISNGKTLTLQGGTFSGTITMDGGMLVENGATLTGQVDGNNVEITTASKADIKAAGYAKITVGTDGDTYSNKLEATELIIRAGGGSRITLNNADVETLSIENGAEVTVDKKTWTDDDDVEETTVVDANSVVNSGKLNVTYLEAGSIKNHNELNVTGELNATAVENLNKVVESTNGDGSENLKAAKFNVGEGAKTSAAAFSNTSGTAELNWNSTEDMNLTVTNNGIFNVNEKCDLIAAVTNNAAMNIETGKVVYVTTKDIDNYGTLSVETKASLEMNGANLNVKNGSSVDVVGVLNGSSYINVEDGGEVLYTVTSQNMLEDALGSNFVYAKYTGLKVKYDVTALSGSVSTDKKLYLYNNLTAVKALTLNGGVEICSDITLGLTSNVTISEVTVAKNHTLTLTGNNNLTVTGNVTIEDNATVDINATGTTVVKGKFTGTGSLDLSRSVSTVQGKYDRTLTIVTDSPIN